MRIVEVHQRPFRLYLSAAAIAERVAALGVQIRSDYADKQPIFVNVLNGAFIFAADLARATDGLAAEFMFVRLASYRGLASSGAVAMPLGFDAERLRGRHVIIVEDIIDTGNSMAFFLKALEEQTTCASVALAACIVKPKALQHDLTIAYTGFEVPNDFLIGYGLDYDDLGRNLADIYQLAE
jgi:hypoxanthine phosphoribosyltransferase